MSEGVSIIGSREVISGGKALDFRGSWFAGRDGYSRGRLVLDRVGICSVVLSSVGRC